MYSTTAKFLLLCHNQQFSMQLKIKRAETETNDEILRYERVLLLTQSVQLSKRESLKESEML